MRPLALVLALTIMTSGLASAADANATGKQAAEFAKRVTLAVQAAKTKNGQYPASVPVVVNGKSIDIKVQVTPLAEGYSIKAQPALDAKAGCPFESCNIDVNADKSGLTIVSLVGTAADGSDIVAFATTGTELAVTVTQGDQTTTMTTTTAVADVPAQAGEAVAVKTPETTAKPGTTQVAPAQNDVAANAESVGKVAKSDNVKASVIHSGKQSPALAGTALAVGDVVSVDKADEASPLVLDLFDGAVVQLTAGAEVTILSNDTDPVIALGPNAAAAKNGTDYDATIDSGALSQIGRHLVVNTENGSVRTEGTLYSIKKTKDGALIKVKSGSITLTSPQFPGAKLVVDAKQSLKIAGNTATIRDANGNVLSTTTVTTVNGVLTSTTTNADGLVTAVTTADPASSSQTPADATEVTKKTIRRTSDDVDVFTINPPANGSSGFILSIDATASTTPVSP